MRHLIFSAFFVLSGFNFYSQGSLDAVKSADIAFGNNPQTMNYFNDFREIMGKQSAAGKSNTANIEGSAYDSENFLTGTIIHGEKTYKNVLLRYNVYADEVEMKISDPEDKKNDEIYGLVKTPELSFVINNEKIKYTDFFRKDKKNKNSGNLFVLFEGNKYSLYKRKLKIYKGSKKATTSLQRSFPARFVDDMKYYLQAGEQTPVLIKPKLKYIISLLNNTEKDAVKDYVKENNIDIKKERDLITLFSYINKL